MTDKEFIAITEEMVQEMIDWIYKELTQAPWTFLQGVDEE